MIIEILGGPQDGTEVDVPTPPFQYLELLAPDDDTPEYGRYFHPAARPPVLMYRLARQITGPEQWRYVYIFDRWTL